MSSFGSKQEEKYAYHITPKSKEDKIEKEGLKKSGGRIYLTATWNDCLEWCQILYEEVDGEKLCIYEADISGIEFISVPYDSSKYPSEIIVEEDISAERLIKIEEYEEKQ